MAENGEFEIIARDGLSRIGRFTTPHGIIETPTVMPVINPNLIVIKPGDMKRLGVNSVITNSYIIRRSSSLREKAEKSGVHALIGFDGPVMTDSGTFQSYVYGDIEFGNSDMVDFQRKIGSDIITLLDIFSTPQDSFEKALEGVRETYRRSLEVTEDGSIYAGTIQGSIYPELRKKSARLMSKSIAGYLPIGGVVPLLESYSYRKLAEIIYSSKTNSDFSKPVHLFGGGHPMFLALAVYLGVDMFDSASYVKYARDGRLLFPDRTVSIDDLNEIPPWSPLHEKYTINEIKSLDPDTRMIAFSEHNLSAIFNEISEVRQRISDQSLRRYVQQKVRAHPALYDAFLLISRKKFPDRYEPLSKKSPYYFTGEEDTRTAIFRKLRTFCLQSIRNERKDVILVEGSDSLFNHGDNANLVDIYEKYSVMIVRDWNGIPVPMEMWETYPVQQSISIQKKGKSSLNAIQEKIGRTVLFHGSDDLRGKLVPLTSQRYFDIEKIRMISRYQFPGVNSELLFPDSVSIRRSRKTGRIRTVSLGDDLIATLRAGDGLLTFTMKGAARLYQSVNGYRVSVNEESAAFNADGKNVFYKFITDCDPNIIPGNETLVVDKDNKLLAVGKSMASGREMRVLRRGVAIDVRAGINHE